MNKIIIYSLIGMFIIGGAIIMYLKNNGNAQSKELLKEDFGIDLQPSFIQILNTAKSDKQIGFQNDKIVIPLFDKENITFTLPTTINNYSKNNNVITKDFDSYSSMKWYMKDNDTFEWEIILKKKPLTNTIIIPISTKDYNWYYQPPLNQEYNNYSNCNETDCWGFEDRNSHRPLNVVGSYAVYSSTKKNNEYKTGKVFHLYRPFLIDANDKTTWASYNEDVTKDGSLIITLPQDFLDNAKYPIIIDPTFGYTTTPGSYAEHGGPALRILTNYTPASNGTVTNVSIYFGGATTSSTVRPVIYYWNGSAYRNVTHGAEMSVAPNGWINQTVNNVAIDTTKLYGLGFWYSSTQDFAYDTGARILRRMSPAYSSTNPPPDPFSQVASIGSSEYGVYATYTASADTTPPKYQNIAVNNTNPAILDYVLFSTNWTDDVALSSYTFSWNATGLSCDTWANDSNVVMTGVSNWSNITKQIPATCLLANVPSIGIRIYANDSSNNWNETGIKLLFTGGASTCWTYDAGSKKLTIPNGCLYNTTGSTI